MFGYLVIKFIKNNIMKKKFQNLIFIKIINKKEGYAR